MSIKTVEAVEGPFKGGFRFGGMDLGDPEANTSMIKDAYWDADNVTHIEEKPKEPRSV